LPKTVKKEPEKIRLVRWDPIVVRFEEQKLRK